MRVISPLNAANNTKGSKTSYSLTPENARCQKNDWYVIEISKCSVANATFQQRRDPFLKNPCKEC